MMKAVRYHGKLDVRIEEIPRPQLEPGKVLINVEWNGICGTDLHEYLHGPVGIPLKDRPHPATGGFIPIVLGHEFCGRIAETLPGSKFQAGQPVMVDPRLYCTSCTDCKAEATNHCPQWGFTGLAGGNNGAGLSDMVTVDERMVYLLPDSVPLSDAALMEPLSVVYHAIKVSKVQSFSGISVLVSGGGPIGVAMVYAIRAHGGDSIFVSEPTAARRTQLAKVADAVMDPIAEDVHTRCRELTGGQGIDVVFDCSGVQVALDAGANALRWGGLYMVVAGWGRDPIMSQVTFMLKELRLAWSFAYDDSDFSRVVEAFKAGKFKGVENMVTSRIHLDDVVKLGFEELVYNKDNHVKILVTPRRELLATT